MWFTELCIVELKRLCVRPAACALAACDACWWLGLVGGDATGCTAGQLDSKGGMQATCTMHWEVL